MVSIFYLHQNKVYFCAFLNKKYSYKVINTYV